MHCWDEKNPICFVAGCCLCSEPRPWPWGQQGLSSPSCQGTLLFFPSWELEHGESQPNLLFQLHFSHFMLVCGMLSELLTSGVPAVPGPRAQFPLQGRPPSLPFYLHNNTTPWLCSPLCSGWVPENHRHFTFHLVLCSFPVSCILQDGLTVINYFLSIQELNLKITVMYMAAQEASREGFLFCLLWIGCIPFFKLDPAKFCHPELPRLGN